MAIQLDWLTKDNITFVLALIGSIGTILNGIYTFITYMRKMEIIIYDYDVFGKTPQFFIHFQNQSFLPICIMSVSFMQGELENCCELIPYKIRSTGNDIIKTPMFPINLSAKQGCLYFLRFSDLGQISLAPGDKVDFVIYSNRGPIHKSVTLSEKSRYLHIC